MVDDPSTALTRAREIVSVDSAEAYQAAVQAVRDLAALKAQVEDTFRAPKVSAHASHKAILAAEKRHLDAIEAADRELREALLVYADQAERVARRSTAEWRATMLRDAERDRVRVAARLLQDGQTEDAHAVLGAPLEIDDPTVAPLIPKIKGVSIRHSWRAEIVDPEEFLRWAVQQGLGLRFFAPTSKALDQLARDRSGENPPPGLRFERTASIAIGTR